MMPPPCAARYVELERWHGTIVPSKIHWPNSSGTQDAAEDPVSRGAHLADAGQMQLVLDGTVAQAPRLGFGVRIASPWPAEWAMGFSV